MKQSLARLFSDHLEEFLRVESVVSVSGGDINQACQVGVRLQGQQTINYFVKYNALEHEAVLRCEYHALSYLNAFKGLNYPEPCFFETDNQYAYLVMPFIHFSSLGELSAKPLAQLLVQQHKIESDQFGWLSDNYIGLNAQCNQRNDNWLEFYIENRLMPQLELAIGGRLNASLVASINELVSRLDMYFQNYQPVPSLLHGDLWSGNVSVDSGSGNVVMYDPAIYYGDREADIAMTLLFGGFPNHFYDAYQAAYPLDSGFNQRRHIYDLYHGLNHFNLFGASYESMIQKSLSKLD